MATEMEFVNYKEFVEGLSETENPTATDKQVVCNETDGPRSTPSSAKALTRTETDGDLKVFNATNGTGKMNTSVIFNNFAEKFNKDKVGGYKEGEFVMNEGSLYRFNSAHASGVAWLGTDATKVPVDLVVEICKQLYLHTERKVSFKSRATLVEGGYLKVNGQVEESAGWRMFYLDVAPGQIFDIKRTAGINAYGYIFLDENENVIGYEPRQQSITTTWMYGVIIPNGGVKLVVNSSSAVNVEIDRYLQQIDFSMVSVEDVSQFLGKRFPFVGNDGSVKTFNLSSFFGYSIENLVDALSNWTLTDNYFKEGHTQSASTGWSYYTRLVYPGEKYIIRSTAGQSARLWFLYDENDGLISFSSDTSTVGTKEETIVIPINGAKLICNSRKSSGDTPFFAQKVEIVINAKNVDFAHAPDKSSNNLYGKVLVSCGDSITNGADMDAEGIISSPSIPCYKRNGDTGWIADSSNVKASYPYQVAARNNMTLYKDAIDGSTIEDITDKHGFSKENGRYTALPDNIDYLTIWFGWNDSAYGVLGTISDNTNTTFYGAYNIVLPYLIDKYPYTKICLCVPFGATADIRQAVRNLGNKWGLAVFDFYGPQTPLYYGKEDSVGVNASIVTANRAKFQANGAHPNFKGHRQLADMLEAFLKTI